MLSGLRVLDIRDPLQPKEIAYFNGPIEEGGSAYAMSSPSFVPERSEIWYSDGNSGFYAIKLTNGAWPFTGTRRFVLPLTRRPRCATKHGRRGVRGAQDDACGRSGSGCRSGRSVASCHRRWTRPHRTRRDGLSRRLDDPRVPYRLAA